ncbi:L-rhamnose mutarotase [Streptomyces sp. BPSDS2]|nr:L-rhamnose mutarotase [Streptomyces sp. BPSDS2]
MGNVRRVASVMGIRESAIEDYERYHRDVWPEVLAAISAAGIQNYSIYRFKTLLFSYWEYEGDDYEGDLAAIDDVPACIRWNDLMATLQVPVEEARPRSWLPLPEVFHLK